MSNKNIILQNCGFSTAIERENPGTIDITVQALHTGIFVDMNGTEVIVDDQLLNDIGNTYNENLAVLHAIDSETDSKVADISLAEFENRNAPNQLGHNASDPLLTVGHVVGLMEVKKINNRSYLFCTIRVKGEENIIKVKDKRFRNLSVQFNPETFEFVEISWVVKGAAYEAHTLLGKSENKLNNSHLSKKISNIIDTIHEKRDAISFMKKKLDATKHLIALSKTGLINMAQVKQVKSTLENFNNPEEVVKLLESVIPKRTFKPQVINDKQIINKLLKGANMANNTNVAAATDLMSVLKNTVSLEGNMSGVEHACIGEDSVLGYDDVADKHMELMSRSMESYESGDKEMGRKFGELAKKLAGEVKAKKAKLADYEVNELAEDTEEVKELAKKIKAAEEEVKEDVKKELAAFEEKITLMLASKIENPKDEIKDIKDAIVLLTKLAGVK